MISKTKAQINLDFSISNALPFHEITPSEFKLNQFSSYSTRLTYIPKKIGVGLQFSMNTYETNTSYFEKLNELSGSLDSSRETWKSNFLFIGPLLKLGNRFNLELFPKIGIGGIQSPDRILKYETGNEEILIYQDNTQSENFSFSNIFYGVDANINIPISKNIGAFIFAGFSTNKYLGDGHSTIYRDISSLEEISAESLKQRDLLKKDCDAYSLLNTGIGIRIVFNQKEEPSPSSERKQPPLKEKNHNQEMYPPIPKYPENESTISKEEVETLTLEWFKESPNVRKANYQFFLYEKGTDTGDSLIHQTKIKRKKSYELPEDLKLINGKEYVWKVRAVDDPNLKPCPDDCYSIKYEFKVGNIVIPQYYQLLTSNSGNYVPTGSILRFVLNQNIFSGGKVELKIVNEEQQVVLNIKDLKKEAKSIRKVGYDRYEIDIGKLNTNEIYHLKIFNIKRSYFLRFKVNPNAEINPRK